MFGGKSPIGAVHVGRSWTGHWIEDDCPCEKAPCGLVIMGKLSGECDQHDGYHTIRQSHLASDCPAKEEV